MARSVCIRSPSAPRRSGRALAGRPFSFMKKLIWVFAVALAGAALFGLGWFLGQRTTAKTASDLLTANSFSKEYAELTENQVVIEHLDSGRIDDAKQTLRRHQDSSILGLDILLESRDLSAAELSALREQVIRDSGASMPDTANRLLARVAYYRAGHPSTYQGKLAQDKEVEAKIGAILKRASEARK